MASENLEQRVAALEAEVLHLKEIVEPQKQVPWYEEWFGAFLNDPLFERAMKYGRQYRESTRPKKKGKRKKKHGAS
jgi:hypothetical protein